MYKQIYFLLLLSTAFGVACSDKDEPWPTDTIRDAGVEDTSDTPDTSDTSDGLPPLPLWNATPTPTWQVDGPTWIFASPRAHDIDGDGVQELILGHGKESIGQEFTPRQPVGYVTFRNASDGTQRTRTDGRDELVGSAALADLDQDQIVDAVIGGRNAELMAISGEDGRILWQFYPNGGAKEDGWFNFYSAQIIDDVNQDQVPDILAANGGDATKLPYEEGRPAGHVMVLSGKDGELLASAPMPDEGETYMSPIVYKPSADSAPHVILGTGGETLPGGLWITPLDTVLSGDISSARQIVTPVSFKGMIPPPSVGDLDDDGWLDIVIATFDGRLVALDGEDFSVMWQKMYEGTETIASPALGHFDDQPGLDVAASFMFGQLPLYIDSVHVAVQGSTGEVIWQQELAKVRSTSSPIAVDLNNDGLDEVLWTLAFYRQNTTVLSIFDPSTTQLYEATTWPGMSLSTPWVGDLDKDGRLELIVAANQSSVEGAWNLTRYDLDAQTPERISWGAYLGTLYNGQAP